MEATTAPESAFFGVMFVVLEATGEAKLLEAEAEIVLVLRGLAAFKSELLIILTGGLSFLICINLPKEKVMIATRIIIDIAQ